MIAVSRAGAAMGRLLSRLSFVAGLLLVASPAVSQSLPSGNPAAPEQVRFYHADALGSVRAVTDIDGEIVSRSDYLPFGEQIPADRGRADIAGYSEDAGNKQKFTGKERDGENGLDYFGARYFSGAQGRFTSQDPSLDAKTAVSDPQRWNRYAYVSNCPLRFVDPDGREQAVIVGGKTYMAGVDGKPAGDERAKNIVFAGLVGTTVLTTGGVAAVTALTPATATGSSVVLGETMRRVEAAAEELNGKTFQTPWTNFTDVMAKNVGWLRYQMARGNRIFDVGLDVAREVRSDFYAAEVKVLEGAGFVRQYVSEVKVGEVVYKVYEWVRPVVAAPPE